MEQRRTSGGNLLIAVIIAIIVGVVVYFLIDSKPVVAPTDVTIDITGATTQEGAVAPATWTGG